MTSFDTHVNTLTSSDFDPADVAAAVITAKTYVSAFLNETVTENQSDGSDMAVAMLAKAILEEGRMVLQGRSETNQPRSIAQLFTREMQELLIKEDQDDIIDFSNENPTQDWSYPYGGYDQS